MTPEEILAEHMVDIRRIAADFSDAFERIQTSSTRDSCRGGSVFTTGILDLDEVQKMLSRKQIAGKWHLITLQEASDYVDHAILQERFYVTHFAGCAVLFNKDTFYPNVDVKSIYFHDTRRVLHDLIVEGEHGWVLQGVVSRASFRRAASSGQTVFTVLSLHINNVFAKNRGIAKKIIQAVRSLMISKDIDLVAGDFNGAAWRCRSRDNLSSIYEAFAHCALRFSAGPHTVVGTRIHPEQLGGRLWFS